MKWWVVVILGGLGLLGWLAYQVVRFRVVISQVS